ncbi:hypothetical protein PXH69_24485 [Rhodococcus qingshengii]|uniref:Phage protein n=1 Tax=Rhodococcus qingshengii TaxID=334542 RepID=A0AAW6LNI7_RHOSG|nr:hypothetical protein [Rhodococcus qingshengii]MDE8648129.1 hypothetical protein [Rhodococcus qingshengii]
METPNILDGTEQFIRAAGQLPSAQEFGDPALHKFRRSLLAEEHQEYLDAELNHDPKEVMDGLLDQIVVVWGSVLIYSEGVYSPKLGLEGITQYMRSAAPKWENEETRTSHRIWLQQLYSDYESAEATGDRWNIVLAGRRLARAAWIVLLDLFGPDAAREAANEVTRSNLAKIVDGAVIRHPETGKILKPEGWVAPDIASVLVRHGLVAA